MSSNRVFDDLVMMSCSGKFDKCQSIIDEAHKHNPFLLLVLVAQSTDLVTRVTNGDSSLVLPKGGGSNARLNIRHLPSLNQLQKKLTELTRIGSDNSVDGDTEILRTN